MATPSDRGQLLRETLANNPTNHNDGGQPCYINEEALKEMLSAGELSAADVQAVKSQPRDVPAELRKFFGSQKGAYAVFGVTTALQYFKGLSLSETVIMDLQAGGLVAYAWVSAIFMKKIEANIYDVLKAKFGSGQ